MGNARGSVTNFNGCGRGLRMDMREVTYLRDTLENGSQYVHRAPTGDMSLQILLEVEVKGSHYALMRGDHHGVGEAYLYEVSNGQLGEIDNEVEWEQVIDQLDQHLHT